ASSPSDVTLSRNTFILSVIFVNTPSYSFCALPSEAQGLRHLSTPPPANEQVQRSQPSSNSPVPVIEHMHFCRPVSPRPGWPQPCTTQPHLSPPPTALSSLSDNSSQPSDAEKSESERFMPISPASFTIS